MSSPLDSFLLFADFPSARARSAQLANALGCDGVFTKWWHETIALTNGQGALVVRPSGAFGTKPGPTALSQLTPSEIAALVPYATVQPLLPVAVITL